MHLGGDVTRHKVSTAENPGHRAASPVAMETEFDFRGSYHILRLGRLSQCPPNSDDAVHCQFSG